tara:strand:+ start:1087 stop:1335 length:249 start_codon:yes stop_codon:yes gene_type:complete
MLKYTEGEFGRELDFTTYLMLKEYVEIGTIKGTKPDDSWTVSEIQAWLDLFEFGVNDHGTTKENLLKSASEITKYLWYPHTG